MSSSFIDASVAFTGTVSSSSASATNLTAATSATTYAGVTLSSLSPGQNSQGVLLGTLAELWSSNVLGSAGNIGSVSGGNATSLSGSWNTNLTGTTLAAKGFAATALEVSLADLSNASDDSQMTALANQQGSGTLYVVLTNPLTSANVASLLGNSTALGELSALAQKGAKVGWLDSAGDIQTALGSGTGNIVSSLHNLATYMSILVVGGSTVTSAPGGSSNPALSLTAATFEAASTNGIGIAYGPGNVTTVNGVVSSPITYSAAKPDLVDSSANITALLDSATQTQALNNSDVTIGITDASHVLSLDLTAAIDAIQNLQGITVDSTIQSINITDFSSSSNTPSQIIQAMKAEFSTTAGSASFYSLGSGSIFQSSSSTSLPVSLTINAATALAMASDKSFQSTGQTDLQVLQQVNGLTLVIQDSAANVVPILNGLESGAGSSSPATVQLTDSGFATLSISTTQLSNDLAALKEITGNFTVSVAVTSGNLALAGLASHGNTAVFSGSASQYTITPSGNGIGFSISNGTQSDQLSNFTALQFSDLTDIVAQTPGTTVVTSGNVTELYGAVFGRLPDVPGLAYYESVLQANPTLSLTVFAQWFIASPEYVNNSAHVYAQTTAGDTQFITDIYHNLLNRTPETGAVPYYLNTVIAPFLQGLTPGTSAYTSAVALAHAYVITDFSASAEFLNDVTITAQNPASTQHWLALI